MRLRKKIILIISGLLLFTVLSISTVTIYSINKKGQEDLASYRQEEFEKVKKNLKNIVEVSVGLIEAANTRLQNDEVILAYIRGTKLINADSAELAQSSDELLSKYRNEARTELMRVELDKLAKVRFDNGEGYFWITDNKLPYPTMIMHAAKPQNEGKVMSDVKYNTEKYEQKNIYQKRAELCNQSGEGFVEYTINKPGQEVASNKLSFSKLEKSLQWVISSGIYTDQIQEAADVKAANLYTQQKQTILFIVLISVVIIGVGIFIIFYFSTWIINGINSVNEKLTALALGREVDKIGNPTKDELGQMQKSLNSLVDGQRSYVSFAKEIGNGNLNEDFEALSEGDVLGTELTKMRDNLIKASQEERIRSWATEGIAKFGEILRSNNTNISVLGDEVLSTLVDYVKINQGAMYVTNEEEEGSTLLKMVACYAYHRKKFLNKKIGIHEGLVGQCYLEKAPIYLKDAPPNYINITSGLGSAPPSFVALLPLINNDVVYGVLEMASFTVFTAHEKEFMQDLCESIATTISAVQINEKTKELLEESQQMGEQMKAQEEELRQNQEELQATQEEMERKQVELEQENKQLKKENQELKSQVTAN